MKTNKVYVGALITSLMLMSAVAGGTAAQTSTVVYGSTLQTSATADCTVSGNAVSCGGDEGSSLVLCVLFPPIIDYCQYTETSGTVSTCIGNIGGGSG